VLSTRTVPSVLANWRSRVQTRDAAFSLKSTPRIVLSNPDWSVGQQILPGRPAQPLFDDAWIWWNPAAPDAGVVVPTYGLRVRVLKQTATKITIDVNSPRVPAN
jgi:immune inhibitor A